MSDDEKRPEGEAPAGEGAAGPETPGGEAGKPKPAPVKPAPPRPAPPKPPPPRPAPPAPAASRASTAAAAGPAAPPAAKPEDPLRRPVPSPVLDALREAMPGAIEDVVYFVGEVTVRVKASSMPEVARFLRDDPRCRMNLLSDLSAVDLPKEEKRFEVNYHLYSIPNRQRLRVKVRVAEGEKATSVVHVWPTADWHEREAFDMFGILFEGHPNLRRILMPDDWKGHPLRKEYPLEGFPEQHPRFR